MKLLVLILSIVLVACTDHYENDEFDLAKLKESSATLFDAVPVDGKISAQWWPAVVVQLKPKEVRKNEDGIYIVLDAFFSQESGLFVPSANGDFTGSLKDNSDYIFLSHGMYSYHVKK